MIKLQASPGQVELCLCECECFDWQSISIVRVPIGKWTKALVFSSGGNGSGYTQAYTQTQAVKHSWEAQYDQWKWKRSLLVRLLLFLPLHECLSVCLCALLADTINNGSRMFTQRALALLYKFLDKLTTVFLMQFNIVCCVREREREREKEGWHNPAMNKWALWRPCGSLVVTSVRVCSSTTCLSTPLWAAFDAAAAAANAASEIEAHPLSDSIGSLREYLPYSLAPSIVCRSTCCCGGCSCRYY